MGGKRRAVAHPRPAPARRAITAAFTYAAYVRRGVRGGGRLVRVRVVSGEVDPANT